MGGNLLGSAVFGASHPPNPNQPPNPIVQIDLNEHPPNPVVFDVFVQPGPPDVGAAYFQVEVGPAGVLLRADPDAAPPGFDPTVEFASLAGWQPLPCAQAQR